MKPNNRLNKCQEIAIQYYKYAPESFKAYIKTTDPNNPNVPSYQKIKGLRDPSWICQKFIRGEYAEALADIKRHLRKQAKEPELFFMTYGFSIDGTRETAFFNSIFERTDVDIETRMRLYKRIKDIMETQHGWRTKTHTTAELGTGYKPEKVTEHYMTINPNKPEIVWLKAA